MAKLTEITNVGGETKESLIEKINELQTRQIQEIHKDFIVIDKNVREEYDPIEMQELALSIKAHGLIQPLLVYQKEGDTKYTLIAGHRRYKACRMAKVDMIRCIIEPQPEAESLTTLQLIENIQRDNLKDFEIEQALQQLIDSGLSRTDISTKLGKSKQWVSRYLNSAEVREELGEEFTATPASTLSELKRVKDKEPEKFAEVRDRITPTSTRSQVRDTWERAEEQEFELAESEIDEEQEFSFLGDANPNLEESAGGIFCNNADRLIKILEGVLQEHYYEFIYANGECRACKDYDDGLSGEVVANHASDCDVIFLEEFISEYKKNETLLQEEE